MTNEKRATMYMVMIAMALHSMKCSFKVNDEDEFTYEFEDPASNVRGRVGIDTLFDNKELNTLTLELTGDDMLDDDSLDTEKIEEIFLKGNETIMSYGDGVMEILFDDLHLNNSSSIATIILHLQRALLTMLKIRYYLDIYGDT